MLLFLSVTVGYILVFSSEDPQFAIFLDLQTFIPDQGMFRISSVSNLNRDTFLPFVNETNSQDLSNDLKFNEAVCEKESVGCISIPGIYVNTEPRQWDDETIELPVSIVRTLSPCPRHPPHFRPEVQTQMDTSSRSRDIHNKYLQPSANVVNIDGNLFMSKLKRSTIL